MPAKKGGKPHGKKDPAKNARKRSAGRPKAGTKADRKGSKTAGAKKTQQANRAKGRVHTMQEMMFKKQLVSNDRGRSRTYEANCMFLHVVMSLAIAALSLQAAASRLDAKLTVHLVNLDLTRSAGVRRSEPQEPRWSFFTEQACDLCGVSREFGWELCKEFVEIEDGSEGTILVNDNSNRGRRSWTPEHVRDARKLSGYHLTAIDRCGLPPGFYSARISNLLSVCIISRCFQLTVPVTGFRQ